MADDKKTSTANSLLIIAALIIIAAGLKSAQALIVPFLLSVFIATIAATPLFWLRARGLKNNIALPTVIVGIITILAVLAGLLASSTSAFAAKLPFYQERLALLQAQLVAFLQQFDILRLLVVFMSLAPVSVDTSNKFSFAFEKLIHRNLFISTDALFSDFRLFGSAPFFERCKKHLEISG